MMMTFWAVAAALMAAALWFVIPPLTRGQERREPSRRDINLALHRDKLAELEADRERGTLSPEQFEQARADLERHLLQDLLADQSAPAVTQRAQPRWLVRSLAVALPLCAVAFYLGEQSGGRDLPQALSASSPMGNASSMGTPMPGAMPDMGKHPQAAQAGGQAKAMSMEEAVVQLSKRLEAKPDDGDGWLLLGNSYRFMGKQKEADDAFKRAAALGKTPPESKAAAAPLANNAAPPAPAAGTGGGEASISALEARLAKHADDAAGWAELAVLEQQQRRFADAAAAYRKAIALDGKNADWLAGAADALASANNSLEGEPAQLIERALAVDPNHVKALWLAASAARQRGDHAKALGLWQRLAKVLPPDSDDARIIAANISEAQTEAKGPASATTAAASTAPAQNARVRGTVVIDDALRKDLEGGETLFVFARAVNGPPMPLAVLRKQASDLPLTFELDDSMALMPAAKLSSAQQVIVGARVSKSGNAIAQPGDFEGASEAVTVGPDAQVRIVIDRRS